LEQRLARIAVGGHAPEDIVGARRRRIVVLGRLRRIGREGRCRPEEQGCREGPCDHCVDPAAQGPLSPEQGASRSKLIVSRAPTPPPPPGTSAAISSTLPGTPSARTKRYRFAASPGKRARR